MSGSVAIRLGLGKVPPPRKGSVAFFANLSHIFFENSGLTDALRGEVEGLETYGGRLLPIIGLLWEGPHNLLVMERDPIRVLGEYFRDGLGLRLPEVVVGEAGGDPDPELLGRLSEHADRRVDGFVTDRPLAKIAGAAGLELAGTVEGSLRGNNKVLLHEHLASRGEPVFDTLMASTNEELARASATLRERGYRSVAAKSQVGASGIGLARFESDAPPRLPACHFRDGPCLVQGWLDTSLPGVRRVASPSVQMLIGDGRAELFDTTDQILSPASIHEGNTSPPASLAEAAVRDEVLRQAGVAASWLHDQDYRGTASADFHLAFRTGGEVEVRVCEVNARVTGATYPSLLARHFIPEGAWLMRNLRLPDPRRGTTLFDDLAAKDLLFRPGMPQGVLPINFNYEAPGRVTKGQFLFLGPDPESVDAALARTLELEDLVFTRD